MIRKFVALLVPLIAILALAQPTGAKVKSEVSVYSWPGKGVLGFVESEKPRICAKGRQVVVWKIARGKTVRIGKTRAVKRMGGFTWSLRSSRAKSGRIGATAVRTSDCRKAKAKHEQMPKTGEIEQCPALTDICHLQRTRIEDALTIVQPFQECKRWMPKWDWSSSCPAKITSGPIPFCCWDFVRVDYRTDDVGDTPRTLNIYRDKTLEFKGRLPKSDSARYTVTDAELPFWKKDVHWFTPDVGAPGTSGGPIYFNIEPGFDRGFDIYIGGFLYRKK